MTGIDAIDLSLQITPSDAERAHRELARVGHVRLAEALPIRSAERLGAHLADELDWSRTLRQGGKIREVGGPQLAAMSPQARLALDKIAAVGADSGFRYLYDVVRVSDDPHRRAASGRLLDRLVDAWNAPAMLELWRILAGRPEASGLTASATRYLPGHFLNAHNDSGDNGNRLLAFVLNLSPHWSADWGGLLQFLDKDGDVERGLVPRFNSLHLFLVPRDHNVASVASFAPLPRLAVSGWLIA